MADRFEGKVMSDGAKIREERCSLPEFLVPLATKDLRLALAEAEHMAVPLPAASLVHEYLVAVAARGWSQLYRSAPGLLATVEAGINEAR
jgi:3-hydroxyisobutyrate dehydrogenase-like beta-hydroxyacid dehydrogenase